MPIITIYSHKGGQGVTTTTAALATLTANAGHKTLIIDTGTDQAAVHGIANVADRWAGLGDYVASTAVTLADITTRITDRLDLIETGDPPIVFDTSTYGLVTGGLDHYDTVIIDTTPPRTHGPATPTPEYSSPDLATLHYGTRPENVNPITSSSSPNLAVHLTSATSKQSLAHQ